MEAILLVILTALLVISIIANVVLIMFVRELQKDVQEEWLIKHLYEAMLTDRGELIKLDRLNSTPLKYLQKTESIIISYYSSRFNQLKQDDTSIFGFYIWEAHHRTPLDHKEYILTLLYKAAWSVKSEVWADLLVRAVVLESQLQEERELDYIAELIGFIITVSNQVCNGEELIEVFESKINTLLRDTNFNEAWKNKIEVTMMRICVSLNVEL